MFGCPGIKVQFRILVVDVDVVQGGACSAGCIVVPTFRLSFQVASDDAGEAQNIHSALSHLVSNKCYSHRLGSESVRLQLCGESSHPGQDDAYGLWLV